MGVKPRPPRTISVSELVLIKLDDLDMASALTRYFILAAAFFFVVTGIPGRKGRKGKGGGRGSKKINNKGSSGGGLVTCPGFAGYCSESYPGDTCLVVCAFGRNNVPVCQVRLSQKKTLHHNNPD